MEAPHVTVRYIFVNVLLFYEAPTEGATWYFGYSVAGLDLTMNNLVPFAGDQIIIFPTACMRIWGIYIYIIYTWI